MSLRLLLGLLLLVVALLLGLLLSLLAMLGLVEIGYLFWAKRDAQKVADLAALAGAQRLELCTSDNSDNSAARQSAVTQNRFAGTVQIRCGNWSATRSTSNRFVTTVDAANPRANNVMGQIIRWKDEGDFDGRRFEWNHLVLAGDPANERAEAKGNIKGDIYACPDGITFDQRGVLWIQTDAHATQMYKGEFARIGNNQMLACDTATGEIRRFLTGPTNCEITGVAFTPDGRNLFISVQHPGETPTDRSDPQQPQKYSGWPDYQPGSRPRSANVVIRKIDGGVIGT